MPVLKKKPFCTFLGLNTPIRHNYERLTGRVLPGHVFSAGRFALFDSKIGDIERRDMHIIGTHLVAERPMSLGTRQRQVVQFQFISLVSANSKLNAKTGDRKNSIDYVGEGFEVKILFL